MDIILQILYAREFVSKIFLFRRLCWARVKGHNNAVAWPPHKWFSHHIWNSVFCRDSLLQNMRSACISILNYCWSFSRADRFWDWWISVLPAKQNTGTCTGRAERRPHTGSSNWIITANCDRHGGCLYKPSHNRIYVSSQLCRTNPIIISYPSLSIKL